MTGYKSLTTASFRNDSQNRKAAQAAYEALGGEGEISRYLPTVWTEFAGLAGGDWENDANAIYGEWTDDAPVDPATDLGVVATEIVARAAIDLGAGNIFDLMTGNEFTAYDDALESLELQVPQLLNTDFVDIYQKIQPDDLTPPSSVYGGMRFGLAAAAGGPLGTHAVWTSFRAALASTTLDGGYGPPGVDPATDTLAVILDWLQVALVA